MQFTYEFSCMLFASLWSRAIEEPPLNYRTLAELCMKHYWIIGLWQSSAWKRKRDGDLALSLSWFSSEHVQFVVSVGLVSWENDLEFDFLSVISLFLFSFLFAFLIREREKVSWLILSSFCHFDPLRLDLNNYSFSSLLSSLCLFKRERERECVWCDVMNEWMNNRVISRVRPPPPCCCTCLACARCQPMIHLPLLFSSLFSLTLLDLNNYTPVRFCFGVAIVFFPVDNNYSYYLN